MIKYLFQIIGMLGSWTNAYSQLTSPGLDALLLNSDIIVQGTCIAKNCPRPKNLSGLYEEICIVALDETRVLKGNPKLSIWEIQLKKDTAELEASLDTVKALLFKHVRSIHKSSTTPDSLSYTDYEIKIGDSVLVFLNGQSNIQIPNTRLNPTIKGDVYSLIDQFLGVITANDYVTDYLIERIKNPTTKQ